MLIEARKEGCLEAIVVIAAALSIQDVRERPLDKEAQADQAHRPFLDPLSDFVTLLNIWRAVNDRDSGPRTMSALKKFCRQHFLSFRRIREWRDIHRQIAAVIKEQQFGPLQANGQALGDLAAAGQADDGTSRSVHRGIVAIEGSRHSVSRRLGAHTGAEMPTPALRKRAATNNASDSRLR